ncbi:M1 family metallopeptidase [Acidobacteriota bacterium]
MLMKKALLLFTLIVCLSFCPPFVRSAEEGEIETFLQQLSETLIHGEINEYLEYFADNIKKEERQRVDDLSDNIQLESVSFFKSHVQDLGRLGFRVFLQVLYQSSYSVVLETWRVRLREMNDQWSIREKTLIGTQRNLYKVRIPGEKVERAKSVVINHMDIKIRFKDALVFYDNIPNKETALLILGDGQVHFSPSSQREKHQLELTFKQDSLDDTIEYAYLRFSQGFFANNIKIVRDETDDSTVSNRDLSKARSLFRNLYKRSFTIENSLTGELLSFLPKGEEAIIEFETKSKGNLAYIYSPFAEEEVNLYQWKKNRIINLYSPGSDQEQKLMFVSFDRLFDIENYEIDIHFNPKESYLSARAKVYIKPNVQNLDGVKLKFNPGLEILRINDEEGHELFFSRDRLRKFLYIYFHNSMPKENIGSIEVFYRGKLVPEDLNEDVISSHLLQESFILSQSKYQTYLYTRSSFWYPAPSDEDYFKARLRIIVPPGYSCVANGRLVGKSKVENLDDVKDLEKLGSSVFVFEMENPLKYLAFIVGEFIKTNEVLEPIPLQYIRAAGVRTLGWDLFKETSNIYNFFSDKFGPYPFEKLYVVHRIWSQVGGHSPPSFIILNELPRVPGRRRLESKKSPVDLSRWREYFLAHEIAHQWWGQGVSWRSYQDQWISEGLAQFAAILFLRDKYGKDTYGQILKKFAKWTEQKSKWGPITLGSRISYGNFEAYQAIVYNKSALVLNMLMDLLGEDVFFRGLQEFFNRFKYTAARTNDFFCVIEEVSGQDLQLFFNSWFYSVELPKIKTTTEVHKRDNGYHLNIKIVQQQGIFMFPLWVEWEQDGKKMQRKILIDKPISEFDLVLDYKPSKVKINPNKAVPGDFD